MESPERAAEADEVALFMVISIELRFGIRPFVYDGLGEAREGRKAAISKPALNQYAN